MKKFLVFPLWIFLGLLIPSVLGIILPKFFNDNIGAFGFIIFILCQFIGYRHFGNIKSKELANDLVGLYFYKVDSIAAMSKQEILLRHNMHKNTQIEDLINLTFDELKDRKIAFDKENMTESQIKHAERKIKSKEELKKSYADLKVAATELKDHVATLPSVIDETKEKYREAKKVWNEPSAFSVGYKKGSDLFGSIKNNSNTVSDKNSNSLSSKLNTQNEVERDQDRHVETTVSSSPIVSTPAKVDSFKAKNVVALSGAVVTWYEDGMMKYFNKCEACAAVETQSEYYTQAPWPGSALDSSFHCYKCRHNNKLIIKAV
jgi:hypothetical protein